MTSAYDPSCDVGSASQEVKTREPPPGRRGLSWSSGSALGMALVAQVHRLLQCLAGGLCVFAHVNHVFRLRTFGWSQVARARVGEPVSTRVRGISAARVLTTWTRRGGE